MRAKGGRGGGFCRGKKGIVRAFDRGGGGGGLQLLKKSG